MDLAKYMEAKGLDDNAMGELIKRNRASVSRYRRRIEPIPSELIKALVILSDGQITANELLGIEQREAAE